MKSTEVAKKRVFLDTNILMDYVLFRGKYALAAEYLFNYAQSSQVDLVIAAHSLTNLFYCSRKDLSAEERYMTLLSLCALCDVQPIGSENITKAIEKKYSDDVEDALQIQCAVDSDCDYFVTRDIELFDRCPVKTLLPNELIKELGL